MNWKTARRPRRPDGVTNGTSYSTKQLPARVPVVKSYWKHFRPRFDEFKLARRKEHQAKMAAQLVRRP